MKKDLLQQKDPKAVTGAYSTVVVTGLHNAGHGMN